MKTQIKHPYLFCTRTSLIHSEHANLCTHSVASPFPSSGPSSSYSFDYRLGRRTGTRLLRSSLAAASDHEISSRGGDPHGTPSDSASDHEISSLGGTPSDSAVLCSSDNRGGMKRRDKENLVVGFHPGFLTSTLLRGSGGRGGARRTAILSCQACVEPPDRPQCLRA